MVVVVIMIGVVMFVVCIHVDVNRVEYGLILVVVDDAAAVLIVVPAIVVVVVKVGVAFAVAVLLDLL